jgi:ESF2/ABP1 family protein
MDPRFVTDSGFRDEDKAESSNRAFVLEIHSHDDRSGDGMADDDSEEDPAENYDANELGGRSTGIGHRMDPDGYAGPSEQVVKPLTPEALAAFNAAQERTGVVYISRIPPGMQPPKVRHLMSAYGEIGRVYLQQEGAQSSE